MREALQLMVCHRTATSLQIQAMPDDFMTSLEADLPANPEHVLACTMS